MTGGDTDTSEITSWGRAGEGEYAGLPTTIKIPRCLLLTTDHGDIMGLHNIRDDILVEAIFRIDDVRNNIFLCGIVCFCAT